MKQEATKKSKLWLWIVIGAVALLAAAGVVVALILGSAPSEDEGPKGGRPELYWNLDRVTYTNDATAGLSTREPGEDGLYHVRFAINGEVVELAVADKQLVNYIDTLDALGLVKDADGVVVDAIDPEEIATQLTRNTYVKQTTATQILANSSVSMNGLSVTINLNELTEIYDVTPDAEQPGKIISVEDLKTMDCMSVYTNDMDQVTHVYVVSHPKQSKVYWRANQSYDSSLKETKRVPDEDGVYTIPFFCDGERVELKTRKKSLATAIDKASRWKCHFGFTFDEEGYIIERFNSALGISGIILADAWDIVAIEGDTYTVQRLVNKNDGSTWTGTIPAECIVYDASYAALSEKRQGKQIAVSDLVVGDRVTIWGDATGTPKLIYVGNHIVDSPAYWLPTRKYSSTTKESTRKPNANGYYEVEFFKEGTNELQTYYVKDWETINYIDKNAYKCFGLKVGAGNVVEYVYHCECVTGGTCRTQGGVVTNAIGPLVTKIANGKPGTEVTYTLAPNVRIYNVSGCGQYGEVTTIRPGDHIWGYGQPTAELVLVFVVKRTTGAEHLYWNLKRLYDSDKDMSTREPDADGWYHFDFAYNGKQVALKTKNKKLVKFIDGQSIGAVGLEVSGDVIVNAYDPTYAYGGKKSPSGYYYRYTTAEGAYHCVYYKDSSKTAEFEMADDCVIYNVSGTYNELKGERIYSLKENDLLTVFCDWYGKAKVVYVRSRNVPDMYWKTDTLYSSSKEATKRVPDADGYYWYNLAVNGEVKTLKTKDQEVANSMDSYNGAFGLYVRGDEIFAFKSTSNVDGVKGNGVTNYCVTAINGRKITLTYNRPTASFGKTQTITLSSKAKIYNVTPDSPTFGAATKLKVGDTVRTYLSSDGKTHSYVYVIARSTRKGGEVGYCEVCKKNVTWNPLLNNASMTEADGHWYVTQDMTSYVQQDIVSSSNNYTICLDLNGHTLTRFESGRMFRVSLDDTLNIFDSVGGGKIVSSGGDGLNGGLIQMASGGTVNMYSGTLEFVQSEYKNGYGGVVYAYDKATFNLYGGTITGGLSWARDTSSSGYGYGGNFYLTSKATVNVYGGIIENGEARADRIEYTKSDGSIGSKLMNGTGGNIYATGGATVNIHDGAVIRGGVSSSSGGNIYMNNAKSGGQYCTLNMYGGKILDGKCDTGSTGNYNGGNIYSKSHLNLLGGTISGGLQGSKSNDIFVYGPTSSTADASVGDVVIGDVSVSGKFRVNGPKSFTLTGAPKLGELEFYKNVKADVGELTEGAEIYVTTASSSPVFTTAFDKAREYVNAGYFISLDESKVVSANADNELIIDVAKINKWCDHCDQYVDWAEYDANNSGGTIVGNGEHYYIPEGGYNQSYGQIIIRGEVTLDLNGQTLNSKADKRLWNIQGIFNIIDQVGGGKAVSDGVPGGNGAMAYTSRNPDNDSTPVAINLYSGTLTMTEDCNAGKNGGILNVGGGGALNVYGGTIEGGKATENGQNIQISSGELHMFGGFIDGGVYVSESAAAVSISDAAKIAITNGGIEFAEGKTMTLGTLTAEAEVYVSGTAGAITGTLTNADSYLTQVKAAVENWSIINVDGVLTLVDGNAPFDPNIVHTLAAAMDFTTTDPDGKVTAECPICRESVEWMPMVPVTEDTDSNPTGTASNRRVEIDDGEHHHYYLSSDVDYTANIGYYYVKSSTKICLNLNGQSIVSPNRGFCIDGSKTLINIMGEGSVTGAGSGSNGAAIDGTGGINLYGGIYTSSSTYPAILMRSSSERILNMYGGTVVEAGNAESAMCVKGKSVINIYGGEVYGSLVKEADAAVLSISGAPVINKLDLSNGMKVTVGELTDGADITVVAPDDAAFTNVIEANADTYAAYFHADDLYKGVVAKDNTLMITDVCPHCNVEMKDIQWTELTLTSGMELTESGHFYLTQSYEGFTQQIRVNGQDVDVVLDLKGQSISTSDRAFYVGADNADTGVTFTLMDTVGTAQVTAASTADGGVLYVVVPEAGNVPNAKMNTLNVYGGTYTNTVAPQGGGCIRNLRATLNIYGGTFNGAAMTEGSKGACLYATDSTTTIYGGTFAEGVANNNGNTFYVEGESVLDIRGGNITGQVLIAKANELAVSGAPVITDLELASGVKITLGKLTKGADITVDAEGEFTVANDNAQAYCEANYIKAVAGKTIAVNEGVMSMAAEATQ